MTYKPPKVHGYDDETGDLLVRRPDDDPVSPSSIILVLTPLQEIFAHRLDQFYTCTSPLLSYFASNTGSLVTLKGTTSDEIWPKLDKELKESFPSLRERAQRVDTSKRHSLSDAVLADEVGR
jgi:adenylate kinase